MGNIVGEVLPVLTYNCCTWGLTQSALQKLDAFHQRQLWSLLGIKWPQRISNEALYWRCQMEEISIFVRRTRWRLFGHILRLPPSTPAVLAMEIIFANNSTRWLGRPRVTLPSVLHQDLQKAWQGRLLTLGDLHSLRATAACRKSWKALGEAIC